MERALVHQITDALPKPEVLQELLPKLLESTDHLINAFVRVAALGHIKSYYLLVPEVFNVAEKHYRDIPQAIYFVRDTDHNWLEHDIRNRIEASEILTDSSREDIKNRIGELAPQRNKQPLGFCIQ